MSVSWVAFCLHTDIQNTQVKFSVLPAEDERNAGTWAFLVCRYFATTATVSYSTANGIIINSCVAQKSLLLKLSWCSLRAHLQIIRLPVPPLTTRQRILLRPSDSTGPGPGSHQVLRGDSKQFFQNRGVEVCIVVSAIVLELVHELVPAPASTPTVTTSLHCGTSISSDVRPSSETSDRNRESPVCSYFMPAIHRKLLRSAENGLVWKEIVPAFD